MKSPVDGCPTPIQELSQAVPTNLSLMFMHPCAGFNAYIVGTITLVVMKGDERTGHYRQRASNLKQYSKVNTIPKVRWTALSCMSWPQVKSLVLSWAWRTFDVIFRNIELLHV